MLKAGDYELSVPWLIGKKLVGIHVEVDPYEDPHGHAAFNTLYLKFETGECLHVTPRGQSLGEELDGGLIAAGWIDIEDDNTLQIWPLVENEK